MNEVTSNIVSRDLTEREAKVLPGLGVVNRLLEKLHEERVVYCHWKSNEHVQEGMRGLTDLDILVDKGASQKLYRILSEAGFKRLASAPTRAYPALEDYLAMDTETGKLVHLHLHYQLIAGETHLKGYRLPWEHLVLSTRHLDTQANIYIADPDVELVLLIVRAALKLRTRDRLFVLLGKPYSPGRMLTEFLWLKERVHLERVIDISRALLGEKAIQILKDMIAARPSFRQLSAFRRGVKPTLRLYRTYSPAGAIWRRWLRELSWLRSAVNKRYLHMPAPTSRVTAFGGLLVAFLGSDGSGKSTLVKETVRWLSWKVDVIPIYFGSGDGPSSFSRWPLKLARKRLRKITKARPDHKQVAECHTLDYPKIELRGQWLTAISKVLWAVTLTYEKRYKLRKATRARNRGVIVICDRYPQSQVMGFNDGPLLSHWLNHPLKLLRTLAQWETESYRRSEMYPPDLVIKLQVTPEVALQRKQNMRIEGLYRRVEAINRLRFLPPTKTVDINADQPLDQVLLQVKQCIWQEL